MGLLTQLLGGADFGLGAGGARVWGWDLGPSALEAVCLRAATSLQGADTD